MKNKISKKAIIFFALSIIICAVRPAYATKDNTKTNLMSGINKINYESKLLKKSQAEKYKKFEEDLDEFYEKGSSKIDSDNMFYLLNTPDFTAEELDNALVGTGLAGLGKDFKKAGDTYGINPLLLIAMSKHETGNGTSELFLNKNNLFGFNAYDYDPYNEAKDFKTPADSINTVAKHLKENYLSTDGAYYKGISTDAIGISYATDPDWSKKVNWMMIEAARSMIDEFNSKAGI